MSYDLVIPYTPYMSSFLLSKNKRENIFKT